MIIDLRAVQTIGRRGVYSNPSVRLMLKDQGASSGRSNIDLLRNFAKDQVERVVVDGDISDLLANSRNPDESGIDDLVLARQISQASSDSSSLVVLSNNYRISGSKGTVKHRSAQWVTAHDPSCYVQLDRRAMKRALLGPDFVGGNGFDRNEIVQNNMDSGSVLRVVTGLVADHSDINRVYSGVSWELPDGSNGTNSYSFSEAIQGWEIAMISNMVFWQRHLQGMLNGPDKRRFVHHCDSHIDKNVLGELPFDPKDYIKVSCAPNQYGTGWNVRVPNRKGRRDSKGDLITHSIDFTNLPGHHYSSEFGDVLANVWAMTAVDRGASSRQGYVENRMKGRRDSEQSSVPQNHRFTASSIAAAHVVHRLHKPPQGNHGGSTKYKEGYLMQDLPFVIPRKKMMDIWHTLRDRTVMVDYDQNGDSKLRKLNLTETENLIWRQVMVNDYDTLFTTSPRNLRGLHDTKGIVQVKYAS
jgi:hypothetical protein